MKLINKILIINLITVSFFMLKPSSINQSDTTISIASGEATDYENQTYDDSISPRSLNPIISM